MENININFTDSKPLNTFSGGSIWKQGFILRIIPKNETNNNDVIYPLPVFYDKITGKILTSTLPPEIVDEYKNVSFYDVNLISGNLQTNTSPHVETQPLTQDSYFTPTEWESNLPQDPKPIDEPILPTLEWDDNNSQSQEDDDNFWGK